MNHAKESGTVKSFFYRLYLSYIPNKRDNIKQIIIKIFFLASLITLIVSASYLTNYFLAGKKQESIIDDSRKIWHETSSAESEEPQKSVTEIMLEENPDFKGWITYPARRWIIRFTKRQITNFTLRTTRKSKKAHTARCFLITAICLPRPKRTATL